ncbi:MAG: kanamycin nucleotidyltransferase C-terminal domain-containing protein [Thermoplasmata archaeon]
MIIAQASDKFWREVPGHALVIAFEQLSKVRNMSMLADEAKLRMSCIWFAETLAMYVAAVNRKVYTTAWDIYESHKSFPDLPSGYTEVFSRLCGLVPSEARELYPFAEQLWESVQNHAKDRDIRMTVYDRPEDSIADC